MNNINTKIVLNTLSIFAALTLVGAATYAYFSDVATSSNNSFGAGNLLLQLDNNGVNYFEDVTATFAVTDFAPNESAAQEISLHNAGTVDIAEIAMGLTSSALDDASPDGSDLRDVLLMTIVPGGTATAANCTGGSDATTAIDTAVGNNNGTLTMTEFTGDTYNALAIPLTVGGGNDKVCIKVTMDSTAGDNYQGDSANASFIFTAHQDASQ